MESCKIPSGGTILRILPEEGPDGEKRTKEEGYLTLDGMIRDGSFLPGKNKSLLSALKKQWHNQMDAFQISGAFVDYVAEPYELGFDLIPKVNNRLEIGQVFNDAFFRCIKKVIELEKKGTKVSDEHNPFR